MIPGKFGCTWRVSKGLVVWVYTPSRQFSHPQFRIHRSHPAPLQQQSRTSTGSSPEKSQQSTNIVSRVWCETTVEGHACHQTRCRPDAVPARRGAGQTRCRPADAPVTRCGAGQTRRRPVRLSLCAVPEATQIWDISRNMLYSSAHAHTANERYLCESFSKFRYP